MQKHVPVLCVKHTWFWFWQGLKECCNSLQTFSVWFSFLDRNTSKRSSLYFHLNRQRTGCHLTVHQSQAALIFLLFRRVIISRGWLTVLFFTQTEINTWLNKSITSLILVFGYYYYYGCTIYRFLLSSQYQLAQ